MVKKIIKSRRRTHRDRERSEKAELKTDSNEINKNVNREGFKVENTADRYENYKDEKEIFKFESIKDLKTREGLKYENKLDTRNIIYCHIEELLLLKIIFECPQGRNNDFNK